MPHAHMLTAVLAALTLSSSLACDPQCEERADDAQLYVERIVGTNQRCIEDQDCMVMHLTTECGAFCAASVAVTGEAAVTEALNYADESWCADGASLGCIVDGTPCPAVGAPYCDGGTCALR